MSSTPPLLESWPLSEQSRHFDLGLVLNSAVTDIIGPPEVGALGIHHSGCWECNLADNSLTWSGGIYDIFGLPRGSPVSRDEAVSFYSEESRASLEKLRSYAIREKRGFTIDVQIRPAVGGSRWVRIIAAPVCQEGKTVRLHGLKLII
jgi:PAS domain-containing protein